jgi:hypothetical protein
LFNFKLRLLYPWERKPIPIELRPDGTHSWSGLLEKRKKSLATIGFEPRNIQPVA